MLSTEETYTAAEWMAKRPDFTIVGFGRSTMSAWIEVRIGNEVIELQCSLNKPREWVCYTSPNNSHPVRFEGKDDPVSRPAGATG